MKKTYIAPATFQEYVEEESMMMTSILTKDGDNYVGDLGTEEATSDGLAKEEGFWSSAW